MLVRMFCLALAALCIHSVRAQSPDWGRADAEAVSSDPPASISTAIAAHETITEYLGPQTCVACHETEAEAMHGSVHYQQTGPTPNVPNIPGYAGERGFGFIGFNTYCGTHTTSSRATCAGCHVGYGRFPTAEVTTDQLNNIDCLMCHQDQYKRTPAGPFQPYEAVGEDGQPRIIQIPIEDATGFDYMPDEAAMSISTLEAARTVHLPTRASCLRCHAGASGSDGGKRGDISSVTVDPPASSDIHMSSTALNYACAECHDAGGHRVRGRGLDLRPNDVPERFTCESCHTDRPHGDYSATDGRRRDTHAGRIACQTCHIPAFAKDISTEMERDWSNPFYSAGACSGQGGWKPEEIRASNVVPTYAWFDGTSDVYVLGQVAALNGAGEYEFAAPYGSVAAGSTAKLYPMKEHRSTSARLVAVSGDTDTDGDVDLADLQVLLAGYGTSTGQPNYNDIADTDSDGDIDLADLVGLLACYGGSDGSNCGLVGELVPHSTFTYFTTGDFDQAVADGMFSAGLSGTYEIVPVHTYQTINHGVEAADSALACGQCHVSGGGQARMDLQGELGYELKGPFSQVCTQCHGYESPEGFESLHEEHVREERFDCAWCHNFSRPERGLRLP